MLSLTVTRIVTMSYLNTPKTTSLYLHLSSAVNKKLINITSPFNGCQVSLCPRQSVRCRSRPGAH
jgi:hypothetical protein